MAPLPHGSYAGWAGFLEPLESTAIHLIQTGIAKLLALFPDKSFAAVERDEYNRLLAATYAQVRDFLVLHYYANERDDSEFWRACRNVALPEGLRRKLALFAERGRVFRYDDDLFSVTSWVAVLLGQGIRPAGYDELVNSMSDAELAEVLATMRSRISDAVAALPTQAEYLVRHCRAQPPND